MPDRDECAAVRLQPTDKFRGESRDPSTGCPCRRTNSGRRPAEQRDQRVIGCLDLGDFGVSRMEGGRRHQYHRNVYEPRNGQRGDHLVIGDADQPSFFGLVARRNTSLGQPRMQIDGMRHDRRADDPDSEHERLAISDLWDDHAARPSAIRPAR